MTVTTTLDRQYFDGDGSNKVFPFNFRFFTNDQIYVSLIAPDGTITLQNLTTNYTLSGALQAGGGTVTMVVAPPLTIPATRVFIQRILPQVQPTSIRNQGKFYPEIHEDAFDRLTMLIQQALAGLANALQLTFSKTGWNFLGYKGINVGAPTQATDAATKGYVDTSSQGNNSYTDSQISRTVRGGAGESLTQLPAAASRANKVMGFDASGQPIGILPATGSGTELAIDLSNNTDIGKGAGMVGFKRTLLFEEVRFASQMLSLSPASPLEKEYSQLVTYKPVLADLSTWDWAPAITACCAANRSVVITGKFNVIGSVTITPGQVIFGRDNLTCGFNYKSSGYLFELLTANGTAEIAGPQIKNMKITTVAGSKFMRLNSKTGGFTDDASSQCYIMRPLVEDCVIEGVGTGTGIEWNKCFNGVINRTKVQGFDTAVDLMGCDSISITGQSRLVANGAHVRAKSAGTFGSGLNLGNVEMLAAKDNLVVSDYRDFILDDSYLEQTFSLSTGVAFDITGGLHFSMWGNRIEIPASVAPTLTKVTGDFFMYRKGANKNSGPAWGADVWNGGAGALYWKNALNRQKIIVDPNASEEGPPFASLPSLLNIPSRFKSAWEMNPSVVSLSNADQGVSVRVKKNAFLFPYSATAQYSFYDSSRVVNGNVNIYLKASASVDGLSLTIQRRNGVTVPAGGTGAQVLTTTPTWYQLYANVNVTDLRMYFLNRDATANGEVYIEALTVDYV